ncbi:protein PF14 0175, partial [Aphis craccivora]
MMDPNNLPHHVYLHKDHKYKLKLGFHAAPSNPKAFSKAIRDELNILKFTYCSDLNGLIMGFGKISSNKLIPADIRHCISVVVNVDVYIFRPPVGSIIEAIVNQTSDNHVSCLVHNLFNVSIVRPENEPYDQWSGSKIKKDDKIDVKVLSFDLTKKLPHITGEIIKKKDDKCYDSTDIQDSSTKSSSSKNIVSDFTKSFNRNTASPSKSSSSDSEITEMTNITMPKISADKSIKTSPLSINTTMKHSEKVDLTVNSSKLSSSDSESSDEMINIMTSSAICDDKPVPSVTTNTIIQQEDTAESAPELSDSDSEFSSKIKAMLSTFKEEDKSKSTKTASHIRNSINNKHIESPLFSSTPILNSEHSVNNINLIRNKQKEQLKKHLAKNSTEKQKSLVSDKGSNQFDKDKLSQSLNILKNNNNNDNSLKVFADSVNSNKNLVIDSKVIQNISRESGSNINDSELEQKSISDNNSFSKKLGKSTKKTKKHKKSNVIVNAILNSINTNKSNANISKHLVDSNNRCIEDDKEENTVYTQHKHNLESKILDEEILNNCKNSNEQAVKNSLTLSLSTKNIKKKDTPQKKDTDNSKNQIKDKKLKKSLNSALSIISDSDSNCSRDLKLAVKDLNLTTDFNENIENETSSSDDEIYSKLKQNISKTQINTNHLNEKPKNQSLPNNKVHTSSDESDSSSKLFFKTPKISSKLIKSNKTKNDSVNMSEPDSCKKSNDNNLLSNEKIIKKDKKRKNVNEKPVHPRLSEKIVDKMDIINHILDNDSNSDNEKVKALK